MSEQIELSELRCHSHIGEHIESRCQYCDKLRMVI